ncbi:sugar phosphate isomerase/epimerase family protein [Planctomicrobium sp. SH668]|uniref:sugar phosphate isomerase/epimerase family protein n=1 Tax=Planctomicrobium sp. SH668 TaxID=3448126 RepID=UPI003F5C4129
MNRRDFFRQSGLGLASLGLLAGAGTSVPGLFTQAVNAAQPGSLYKISLAQWSLHRAFFGSSDLKLDNLEFAAFTKKEFGIDAVEYVNQFFKEKAEDVDYLTEMRNRAEDVGVTSLLIMVDGEGHLGDPDEAARIKTVENHTKWLDAAAFLGCHSIRVNAASSGSREQQVELAADGLTRLSKLAAERGLNVLVENHGGISSDGSWLSEVMRKVNLSNCGTLPDFGNFRISDTETYDRYKGVEELMPFAKAVSAKSHEFDADGNETGTDYSRMMKIVLDAGYRGYVGIEFEGGGVSEVEGIHLTKKLLVKVREQLAAAY